MIHLKCCSLQAVLQQWGRAFAHISRKRRESVVNATDPRIDHLLKDDNVFSGNKEARELLFTGSFLELMLREANQDETLAKRDRAEAAAARGRRNPVRSVRRIQLTDSATRQDQFCERQNVEPGRARGRRGFCDPRGGRARGNPSRRYEL